jgi:TrmH family RNA methyltransferase
MRRPITSPQNQRIKAAVRLRSRKARKASGQFLIDGLNEIRQAVEAHVDIAEAFICPTLCTTDTASRLADDLRLAGVDAIDVARPVWDKLAYGNRQDGIVAVARAKATDLDALAPQPNDLLVVVEGLEKPGNLGAILRTANAVGATALIVADGVTDIYNTNTIRASLGAVFHVPVATASGSAVRDWLNLRLLRRYVARVDATTRYWHADLTQPCALVLGSEAHGLSPAWDSEAYTPICIPMAGNVDSLNVASAAAVLLYEAYRQRHVRPQNTRAG